MRSPAAGQPKEMRCAHMKWISKRTWMEYHTHNIGPMNQKESTCMHHWNPLRWCLLQHCYYARPSRLIRCRETSCVTNKVRAVPGKARSGFQGICILRASETFLWWFHEKTQSADASLAWPTCSPHPRARVISVAQHSELWNELDHDENVIRSRMRMRILLSSAAAFCDMWHI